ncbi:alpha-2-macroglobulin [Campylobacter sp. 9BO]|uniref:alpha-2-macroglobulin family protein n=1 Tax=Campylobacter sp. 9BO TaxID=3424759 RepID=UPI003D3523B2
MLLARLFLPLALTISTYAFELNGEARIFDGGLMLELGTKNELSENLIGKITNKELVKCSPSIEGISEYSQKSIIIYQPNLHAGMQYICTTKESKTEFQTDNFAVKELKKISPKNYVIAFNDDINASELANSLKIDQTNFSTQMLSKKDVLITLDEYILEPNFSLTKGFKSIYGAKTLKDFNKNFSKTNAEKPNFTDNEKAKTLTLTTPVSAQLENGKMGIRFYLKDYIETDGAKKFIKISGIKNFSISQTEYVTHSQRESENIDSNFWYYFTILSDEFAPQTEYDIELLPGFGDEYSILRSKQNFSVKLGDLKPFVNFINDLPYISSVGTIGIKSANTPQIKVVIEKLSDQNYRYFLNFKQHELSELTTEVASKTYDLGGTLNQPQEHKIKLDFAGSGDGVYLINIFYDKDKLLQKAVYLSDIAVNAKLSKDELFVFANRIGESMMLANANVKIYGHKNEELGVGATNDEGIYRLSKKDIYKNAKSVVVSLGKEQNFLIINEHDKLNKNAYYKQQDANESVSAFVHFASNIIRPDENIQGAIYLRTDDFKPLNQMPVRLVFSDPQNKKLIEVSLKTNEFGVIDFNKSLSSELTGKFILDVIYASKKIRSVPFFVESFTPSRIKNEISLQKENFKNNEVILANFTSTYLFGSAAGNLSATAELSMFNKEYKNETYKDFSFKNHTLKNGEYQSIFKNFKLENNGTAQQAFAIHLPQNSANVIDAILTFSTNDDGKSVSDIKNFEIFPFDNIVGVHANKTFVEPNEKVKLQAISLDTNAFLPQKKDIKFQIKRTVWQYNINEHEHLRWFKELEDVAEFIKSEPFEYEFLQSGEYTVIAKDEISGASASIDISVSGFNYSTLAPTNELTQAQIKLNAKKYKAGETISADISSVIKEGIALITLEANSVIAHKLTHIKNNSANAKFEVPEGFDGGYVSASIYRLADQSNVPFRAYSKVYAKADVLHKELKTSINAPKTAKTNQKVRIEIKTAPNSDILLFAVDLGVVNITNQESPNPLKYFTKQLNDGVFDYDIYNSLASYEVTGKVLNFGGDMTNMLMAARMTKHESPVDSKNIESFVKMARLKADQNGTAVYEIKIPQGLNSAVRVDAISTNDDKIGASSQNIIIKDDVVLKPSILSYIVKDDEIQALLRLINTTDKEKNLKLSINSSQNLDVNLSTTSISIDPKQSKVLELKLNAKEVGKANFEVIAKEEDGEIFTHTSKLDIIHKYPKSTFAKSYSIEKARNFQLPLGFKDINIDASTSISSLVATLSKNLIEYPYGCSEQRSSRLLALLHAKSANDTQEQDRIRFIKSGLNELIKMQKSSGEFGYWSEVTDVNTFASIYAADTIFELDNAGFNIDKSTKNRTINGIRELKPKNQTQALYALYILAKFNAIDKSRLNTIYDSKAYTRNLLDSYLMASVFKISGYEKEANSIIKNKKPQNQTIQNSNENFHSALRDDAFVLFLHAKHFEKDSFSDKLAKELITKINSTNSTQERAFVLRALNAYFPNQDGANFKLTYDGKTTEFQKGASVNITSKNGEFSIEPSTPIFVSIVSSAYTDLNIKHQKDQKELDIFRTFVDKSGKEISLNSLKENDIIYSKLEISAKSPIEVGVINEITSTCFEVINENITNINRPEILKNSLNLQYQTLKDDRTISFFSLYEGASKTLFTPYRVVLKGKCNLPAVSVENMYNEEQNDYDLAQKSFIVK